MKCFHIKEAPLIIFYITGILAWGYFFHWGNVPLDFADWSDITAPRLTFLKNAINRGEWPLHTSDKSTVGGVTDRYQSIPDAMLSPQVAFMVILEVGQYVFANTVLLYSFGFLGLCWLKRHFGLSWLPFAGLFLLFNFNGHITAHLSVGHATWAGYFLLPWFAVLVFKLLAGEHGWTWTGKISLLMVAILLQGSYHQYVWLLFFLGFMAISGKRYFWPSIRAGLFSVLLAMPRLWPPSLTAAEYESRFHGGFMEWKDLWSALTVLQEPGKYFSSDYFLKPLGWWELTHYIGVAGSGFVILFVIFGFFQQTSKRMYQPLIIIPILGMTALSFARVFFLVREIPFPLFQGERVASRMFSLPLIFLIILAVVGFQSWLNRTSLTSWQKRLAGLGLVFLMAWELWQNILTWEVVAAWQAFPHENFIPWMWAAANRYDDLVYIRAIQKGLLVSAGSLLVLTGFLILDKKKNSSNDTPIDGELPPGMTDSRV